MISVAVSVADASVQSSAITNAVIGANSTINASGSAILVSAESANHTKARTEGNSFGLADITAMVTDAETAGPTRAGLDGVVTLAGTVTVTATSDNDALAQTESLGIGLLQVTVTGAGALINDTAKTEASGLSGSIHATGAIKFSATGNNFAEGFSDAASGGLGAFAINMPSGTVEAPTTARYDGAVTGGTSMEVLAEGTNTAKATAKVLVIGLIAAAGGDAKSKIETTAMTEAVLGGTVNGLSQKLTIKAHSVNRAASGAGGDGGGLADIKIIHPDAISHGGTSARIEGSVGGTHVDPALGTVGDPGALVIEVIAHGDDATTAFVDTFGIGVVAINDSSATAVTDPTVSASLGTGNVTASQSITVLADSDTDADAFADVDEHRDHPQHPGPARRDRQRHAQRSRRSSTAGSCRRARR